MVTKREIPSSSHAIFHSSIGRARKSNEILIDEIEQEWVDRKMVRLSIEAEVSNLGKNYL